MNKYRNRRLRELQTKGVDMRTQKVYREQFVPVADYVLVKDVPIKLETESGLAMEDKGLHVACILAVGPEVSNKDIAVGDHVVISPDADAEAGVSAHVVCTDGALAAVREKYVVMKLNGLGLTLIK